MKKILVTTDFSSASKSGIRYAIQLAAQGGFKLRFLYVSHFMRPSSWSQKEWDDYILRETTKMQKKLYTFVEKIYLGMGIEPSKIDAVVDRAVSASERIASYAFEHKFDYICVGTLGAGGIKKIIGTHSSWLINETKVPLFVIPKGFKAKLIRQVMYSSDTQKLPRELPQVVELVKPMGAQLNLINFQLVEPTEADLTEITSEIKKITRYPVTLHIVKRDIMKKLSGDLYSVLKKMKPELVIMFTQQERSWFDKLFLPANTVQFADSASFPLLVFPKEA